MTEAGLPLNVRKTGDSSNKFIKILGLEIKHSYRPVQIRAPQKAVKQLERLGQGIRTPRQDFAYAGLVRLYSAFLPKAYRRLPPYYAPRPRENRTRRSKSTRRYLWSTGPYIYKGEKGSLSADLAASQQVCGTVIHGEGLPIMTFFSPRISTKWKRTVGVYCEALALK